MNFRAPAYPNHRVIHLAAAAMLAAYAFPAFAQTAGPSAGTSNPPADPKAIPAKTAPPPSDSKPAPLPLHQYGGSGGIVTTLSAYIVNPPRDGEPVGRPSVGMSYLYLGHNMNLEAATITESPYKRIELGYGWDRLGLGDLPSAVGAPIHEVQLHNANARFQLIEENEFNQKWLPAITFGVHYKYNDGITTLNKDLGGAISNVAGVTKDNGTDFTLYASKLITQLPVPVLVEAGGRETQAVWDGFGGFTNRYNLEFEGNIAVFLAPNLILAGEYKQQPRDYSPIGSVYSKEDDWYTVDAAYIVNKNWTVALAYGHFGNVLNHQSNAVWGITTKWEF
ncbi:MAG: DUF3034 family protein [Verrucomicrobiota bacterium]